MAALPVGGHQDQPVCNPPYSASDISVQAHWWYQSFLLYCTRCLDTGPSPCLNTILRRGNCYVRCGVTTQGHGPGPIAWCICLPEVAWTARIIPGYGLDGIESLPIFMPSLLFSAEICAVYVSKATAVRKKVENYQHLWWFGQQVEPSDI
jgi:hypothetical protein